jgi:tetratricopeptide (TPR) repeat protein
MESANIPGQNRQENLAVSPSPERATDLTGKGVVPGVCALLVVAVFLVFSQTLRYPCINYDDDRYFSANPQVQAGLTWNGIRWAFRTKYASNWHPLTWLSLMLDTELFGPGPMGPHLTNIILHAANVALLLLLLKRLTGALWPSAFVAAVFAVHPLRVESVAWVAERKDVLCGLFFMLTLLMYVRYVDWSKVQSPKSKIFYGLTLFFFALGLMSKPMLVTLPFVLLLLDYWPLNRIKLSTFNAQRSTIRHLILEKLPFFLPSAALCVVTVFAQENTVVSIEALPLSLRISNALISYGAYLAQMFWPHNLAVLYPYRFDVSAGQTVGAGVLLLALTVLAFLAARRLPFFLVGWLWYLGMLVPVIGLVQVGHQSHADRYTYLPQLGLYLAIAWTVRDLTFSWRLRRLVLSVAALTVIATLMVCAGKQTLYWRNSELLWRHTLACTSGNYIANNNLGNTIIDQGRSAEAVRLFQKAIEIYPDYAEAHYNLGCAFDKQERLAEAIGHFQKAIEIYPDYAEANNNLGVVFLKEGRLNEAIKHCQRALEINPDFAKAYYNLGCALDRQGRRAAAIEQYQKAIALKPDFAEAHNNLGVVFRSQGRLEEAVEHFQEVINIKPGDAEAHYNLGGVFGLQNRLEAASQQYRQAVELKPDYVDAHGNLANALAAQGRLDEATQEYRRTLELAPHSAQAHFRFAQALQTQRNFKAAIAEYQATLKLDPRHLPAHLSLAWLLATSPEASMRDGGRAVELARQAEQLASQGESPQILDTLAAAYAEAGRFPEAIETARRSLTLPATRNNQPLAKGIQSRLKLYEANTPYHEKP